MLGFALGTLGLVAALVAADALAWRRALWVVKPLASAGFIAVALAGDATTSDYGRVVLVGLVLAWWGDVLLIPKAQAYFRAGLFSFLLGHVAYAVAFGLRGLDLGTTALAAVALAGVGLGVARWLGPHVPGAMRGPVRAYVIVISTMVAFAVGTLGAGGTPWMTVGAVLFWASDLFVARNRFVAPGFVNRLIGLPLYYAGQLVLAWTVAF